MADEIAYFEFPGIEAVESADYTRAHGRTPGVCTIKCRPQRAEPQQQGALRIYYGGRYHLFPGCIISDGEITRDGSGQIVQVRILDRRWKWQFPTISGRYNLYDTNGNLVVDTEKAPRELAKLCLEAMGEVGFSVEAIPNDVRPFVDWDYSNAAEALESLAEACGCRVVLGIDDYVRVVKLGEGASLPLDDTVERHTNVVDLAEAPDKVMFVGGPDVFQLDFELEAVGIQAGTETEQEKIVPIDELSYAPFSGWNEADLDFLNDIFDVKSRELALANIFKLYRIKLGEFGVVVPGIDRVLDDLKDLALLSVQAKEVLQNGVYKPLEPAIYGIWDSGRDDMENNTGDQTTVRPIDSEAREGNDDWDYANLAYYPYGFSIDTDNHTVRFGETVYRITKQEDENKVVNEVADLRLRIAFHVRDRETGAFIHTTHEKPTGYKNGTKPLVIRETAIHRTRWPRFVGNTFAAYEVQDNIEDFKKQADEYLNAAIAQYRRNDAQTVTYAGLRFNTDLDGAIQQITWTVPGGNSYATTTIYRNNDVSDTLPTYQQMRYRRRLQGGLETLKRLAGAAGNAAQSIGRAIFGGSR